MVDPAQHRTRAGIAAEVPLRAKRADPTRRVCLELVPNPSLGGRNGAFKVIVF